MSQSRSKADDDWLTYLVVTIPQRCQHTQQTVCKPTGTLLLPRAQTSTAAELRGVRPCNLEQSTFFATHPRTVAEHLQSPAEDSAFPAPVIHRPAPLWLISEFGAVYRYSDSTQLKPYSSSDRSVIGSGCVSESESAIRRCWSECTKLADKLSNCRHSINKTKYRNRSNAMIFRCVNCTCIASLLPVIARNTEIRSEARHRLQSKLEKFREVSSHLGSTVNLEVDFSFSVDNSVVCEFEQTTNHMFDTKFESWL